MHGTEPIQYVGTLDKMERFYVKEKILLTLGNLHLKHYFDILGSGWIKVYHGIDCPGIEGARYPSGPGIKSDDHGQWLSDRIHRANLQESMRIWKTISTIRTHYHIQQDYLPIDWQLDFKSGYRWREKEWHKRIRFGDKTGADIKVPRELGKMQHLPAMALCYGTIKHKSNHSKSYSLYAAEFCSQICDFIATNPPRFGVQWGCTMDVGIRAANWLMAYDLFVSFGEVFPAEFTKLFCRSIYEHGLHIIKNLEWHPRHRHNHYLSNIVGLLFVAAHRPRTDETDAWLAFSIQEFINEVLRQFQDDGTNFEASTCYHRLSSEMVVFAAALILGLDADKKRALIEYDHTMIKNAPGLRKAPMTIHLLAAARGKGHGKAPTIESPLPESVIRLIGKMAAFTIDITKPNGQVAQIGDNDSGRFLKLTPQYKKMTVRKAKRLYRNLENYHGLPDSSIYPFEEILDHRHLVAAINGLFDRRDFFEFSKECQLEKAVIEILAKKIKFRSADPACRASSARKFHMKYGVPAILGAMARYPTRRYNILLPPMSSMNEIEFIPYKDFGLYIYRSKELFLSVLCGPTERRNGGEHAHNDQLSIVLNIQGKDWIADPGSYNYTALPEERNRYRSARSHFTPHFHDKEPGRLDIDLFRLGNEAKARVIHADPRIFIGMHVGYGFPVYRCVKLHAKSIEIVDIYENPECRIASKETQLTGPLALVGFSPAYGFMESHSINTPDQTGYAPSREN